MSKPKVLIDLAEYERIVRLCRDNPSELADRTLGALVRQMPASSRLIRSGPFDGRWAVEINGLPDELQPSWETTPEEALRAALEVKDPSA